MAVEKDTLSEIKSQFPTIPLQFGVDRQTDKVQDTTEEDFIVTLDMVESWTGNLIENGEDSQASTGLVKFHKGDVLFNKLRPYLAKAFKATREGSGSPEFLVLRPKKFNPQYLLYMLLSREFVDRVDASTYGAKMPRASWEFIGGMNVPCPDMETQREIAQYLDYHTSRINSLIEKKESLVSKLDEKRKATISHTVSEGLDPSVPLKPATVDWADKIPMGWEVIRLKWLTKKIGSGKTPKGGEEAYVEDGITFLRSQNVHFDGLRLDDVAYIDEETNKEMETTQVMPNDVLLNITGASLGRCALVPNDFPQANVNQHVCIIRPRPDRIVPSFLNYVISSNSVQHQIFADQEGASREAVTFSQIRDFEILVPPVDSQKAIAEYLDQETARIDHLKSKLNDSINLLKEKRQSIIARAIMGQINIDESTWSSQQEVTP